MIIVRSFHEGINSSVTSAQTSTSTRNPKTSVQARPLQVSRGHAPDTPRAEPAHDHGGRRCAKTLRLRARRGPGEGREALAPSQSARLATERGQSGREVWRAGTALRRTATPAWAVVAPLRPRAARGAPGALIPSVPTGVRAVRAAHALASGPPLGTAPRRGRAGRCRGNGSMRPAVPRGCVAAGGTLSASAVAGTASAGVTARPPRGP